MNTHPFKLDGADTDGDDVQEERPDGQEEIMPEPLTEEDGEDAEGELYTPDKDVPLEELNEF